MSPTTERAVAQIRQAWQPIMGVSAWIVTTFCSTFTLSIKLSSQSDLDALILAAANALATIAIALVILRQHERSDLTHWWKRSIAYAISFCISFITYIVLRSKWTCQYTEELRLVIGLQQSEDLRNYLASISKETPLTCSELLADYAGATERMYPLSELAGRFYVISTVYFALWCSLALAITCIGIGLTISRQQTIRTDE